MYIDVDEGRILAELEQLAAFSDGQPPGVTRIVFSPADLKARDFLNERFRDAGLHVRQDPVGNTFARWHGTERNLAAIGTGSHIDAIPHSGRFDRTVGVLGGLEAIRALQSAGYRPRRSIELLIFTSGEPTRFGLGCLGSRLLAGVLAPEEASSLRQASHAIADKRGTKIQSELLNADPPARCARFIIDSLVQSCAEAKYTHKEMISRAYHDSLFMARIVPVGMLFIPCRNGVSHRPDEYSAPESIGAGARVLAHALANLAA